MAMVHAAVQVALAAVTVHQPTDLSLVRPIVLALLIGVAALWGALDGWMRRPEGARTWFIAALVAGPLAGLFSVAGRRLMVDRTGLADLWPAMTGGAAFIALLVLVPAALGLLVGGRMEAAPEARARSRGKARPGDAASGGGVGSPDTAAAGDPAASGAGAQPRRPARHRRTRTD